MPQSYILTPKPYRDGPGDSADATGQQNYQYPRLTITGFTGSKDGTIAVASDSPAPLDPASISVVYTAAATTIVIELSTSSAGLDAGVAYNFTFLYRNREFEQSALSLTIQADRLSNSAVLIADESTWVGYSPGTIYDPTVQASTNVHQSSSNPCAKNTITVSIITSV